MAAWFPDWLKTEPATTPIIVVEPEPEPVAVVDLDLQAQLQRDIDIVLRQKSRVSVWGGTYHRAPWSNLRDDLLGPCPELQHRKESV